LSSDKELDYLEKEKEYVEKLIMEEKITFPLDQGEKIETYRNLAYLLAKIYWRADWSKIAKSKKIRAEDVFQHRIKVAGAVQSIPRFVDKLCNLLSLQNVAISSKIIDELEKEQKETKRILREESIYISRKAIELAKLLREARKKGEF